MNDSGCATPTPVWRIRRAQDNDTPRVVSLVSRVFAEYGLGLDPELDASINYDARRGFRDRGGELWVVELGDVGGGIVGSAGVVPVERGAELRAFYLCARLRGSGLAAALLRCVVRWCARNGYPSLRLWTDTRFTRSHGFYEKAGFRRTGRRQRYGDVNNTMGIEFTAEIECARARLLTGAVGRPG